MKGLLLFIKNNRIIYKASIVSIIILMFISVMQINPNNEKKTISGTISNADYTICFDASNGEFSIVGNSDQGVDVNDIISKLGIRVRDFKKWFGYYTLYFTDVDFSTTAPIALKIENGNVRIHLKGTNKISSSYSDKGDCFYGITTTGEITFGGELSSTLEVNAYNWGKSDNKDCVAIAAYNGKDANGKEIKGKVSIEGIGPTVVANGHGCNGKGIYAESSITILQAYVTAFGGNSSYAFGLSAKEISIDGGIVVTKGGAKAIGVDKLTLYKGGDTYTELIEGSTVYADTDTPSDIIDYPSIDSLASYKYIKIGEVPTYYYRYTNKKLYKVSKDSTKPEELNSTTWPKGCSVTEDGKLVLNGFNFVTTANKVIDIVGEANVLVSGINTIRNVCNTVNNSYGIYSDSIINITSTEGTLDVKGGKSAIAVGSTGRCNVNGRVSASTTVDGELSYIKDSEFNTKCMEYKHVKIEHKVISVDITWGDMDFKYSESDLNEKWSNNTQYGDKITVVNNSNVPVTASIAYSPNSNYEGITGTILQSKNPAAEYKNNTTVIVGRSINAYLSLKGNLSSSTEPKTTIGEVKVTISG